MLKAQVPTSACFVAISITVSLLFPTTWRQDQAFARQLKWLMVAQMYMAGHMVVNNLFFNFVFFISLPSYLQWLAAFALPGIRELSNYMLVAICRWKEVKFIKTVLRRVGGGREDVKARMVISSFLDVYHALFLAITVAGLANAVTTWAFFAVDFLFNAYGLFKIYKAAKNNLLDVGEDVLGMVQGMFLGLVVSIAYLASLVVIFHGPNAEVMGNIKNSYFDFAAIADLESTVESILMIVAIETATSLVTILVLKFKCSINTGLVFVHLMKEYGLIITFQMLYWFYLFFCLLESEWQADFKKKVLFHFVATVACAIDRTFELKWVVDPSGKGCLLTKS